MQPKMTQKSARITFRQHRIIENMNSLREAKHSGKSRHPKPYLLLRTNGNLPANYIRLGETKCLQEGESVQIVTFNFAGFARYTPSINPANFVLATLWSQIF